MAVREAGEGGAGRGGRRCMGARETAQPEVASLLGSREQSEVNHVDEGGGDGGGGGGRSGVEVP